MNLQKKFNNWLDEHHIPADAAVVVGCSGGPDSMVLLWLAAHSGRMPVAAHMNYGKRGEASDNDQHLVEEFCRKQEWQCESKRVDPDSWSGNFQDRAREARYRFFRQVKQQYEASVILTAHHRDDHLETLFLQILRGAHPASWQGIPEVNEDIGRPLLDVSKEAILSYAREHRIPYAVDETNLESGYARNLIRNDITAACDRLLPGWQENLLQMPGYAAEFDHLSRELLQHVLIENHRIDRTRFFRLAKAARAPVFRAWLQRNGWHQISRAQYERLEELEKMQTGGQLQLTDELTVMVDRDELILAQQEHFCAYRNEVLTEPRLEAGFVADRRRFVKSELTNFDEDRLQLNWQKLRFPLSLRSRRPGDRIRPLGMRGMKKISDVLTDSKISPTQKDSILVIEGFDRSIYAVIFPPSHSRAGIVAEDVRCDPSTTSVLLITKTV